MSCALRSCSTRWSPLLRASLSLVSLLALAGCSTSKSAQKDGTVSRESSVIRCAQTAQEKIAEFDLNHDQRPDVWSHTVTAKGEDGKPYERLVCKEFDINWDGKIDIVRSYGEKESIERELLDLDFDGRIDQWNIYEQGTLVRKERDLDFNAKPDLWVYFEKGKLARKERDQDGDGKIDYWEYWEGDKVDRIAEDLDRDGTVDKWTKSTGE